MSDLKSQCQSQIDIVKRLLKYARTKNTRAYKLRIEAIDKYGSGLSHQTGIAKGQDNAWREMVNYLEDVLHDLQGNLEAFDTPEEEE